jgi:hypothetical protein
MDKLPVVAIVNTNTGFVGLLKARIEAAGFVALVIQVAGIRAGLDLAAGLSQYDPKVIVYDVVAPCELQQLRETTFGPGQFVLTSPNVAALAKFVGRDEHIYEVIDDGADIDAILRAVRARARGGG